MKLIAVLAALLLGACATKPTGGVARLYPANPEAEWAGAFIIEYSITGEVGEIAFTGPDGEAFRGSYTTLSDDASIRQVGTSVLLADNQTFGATGGIAVHPRTSRIRRNLVEGRLNASGAQGTIISCDYLANRRAGTGMGTCTTNRGAIYRMHFSVR